MAVTYVIDAPTPVLAYSERESWDPVTGAEGTLRQEWRAVPFDAESASAHRQRWHPAHCGRALSYPSLVLECRYIRRGTVEPWEPFDAFEHLDGRYEAGERSYGLLESLLHGHSLRGEIVAIDPRLRQMQEDEAEAARQSAAKRQAEDAALQERRAKTERRRRGSVAFGKLAATQEGQALCALWGAFVGEATADAIERYRADPEFMRLYEAAMSADRVPAKRKALKEFFKYAGV